MAKKTISVKVATAKVVKALEEAASSREKQIAEYEKAKEAHQKAVAEWEKKVLEAVKSGKAKPVAIAPEHSWRDNTPNRATVQLELTAGLSFPKEPERNHWSLESELEELRNAIALLKMTDEEFVSTNTYAGVARYIS